MLENLQLLENISALYQVFDVSFDIMDINVNSAGYGDFTRSKILLREKPFILFVDDNLYLNSDGCYEEEYSQQLPICFLKLCLKIWSTGKVYVNIF